MLKRIPKSDISIRPFKAYKEWNFSSGSNQITFLEANISSSELSNGYPKNSIYGQLRAQFYNGLEDNPFLRFGSKNNTYETSDSGRDRFLSGSAKVISIPQIYVGEGVTATTADTPIPAGTPIPFNVPNPSSGVIGTGAPWVVSAIQVSAGGILYAKPINIR